jgi:hypothetical protein
MRRLNVGPTLCLLVGALFSVTCAKAPKIEITPTEYNCGTFLEGKIEQLKAPFVVKNTGDATLRIQEVRPGCGCTVVKFDSIIEPGETGYINAVVNLGSVHPGALSKSMHVTSNAKNAEMVELVIKAMIRATVDISEQYITIPSDNTKPTVVYLTSQKKNLKVTEITFLSSLDKKDAPSWQKHMPIGIHFKFSPTDSTAADGYKVFKLEMFRPQLSGEDYGEMTIKTNHPDKSSIVIQANYSK